MAGGSGEYEPRDSRNVTGTASTPDGRWTNESGKPLDASGQAEPEDEEAEDEDGGEDSVTFEPDPELEAKIARGRASRDALGRIPGTDRPNPG